MDNARRSKGLELAYTGTMTQSNITVSGALYTLYTLTMSGTLTVKGKGTADIWCCGGGANGLYSTYDKSGGGGGYFAQADAQSLAAGDYTVTIGAAQGTTSIAKGEETVLTAAGATSKNGASGGGGFCYVRVGPGATTTLAAPGTGGGVSTRPFGDSVNFTSLPCAGGGGSYDSDDYESGDDYDYGASAGGAGGSNGGSGGAAKSLGWDSTNAVGGSGGATGGGKGSSITSKAPESATYYGSGGGGGSQYVYVSGGGSYYKYGYGYQGVCYIRVPQTSTPSGTAYQYYRLNMTSMMRASTASTYFSVAELALYNGSTAVSYTGATYTASSSMSGYAVGNAFDGSSSTIWHTDGAPESAWIQVQLASASKITSFAITPRTDQNDRLNAFTLQGSNDGSTWTTLYTGTNTASGWAQGATKTFTI